jgi:hypothetical protein
VTRRLRWLVALAGFVCACAHASPPVATFGHCTTAALEEAGKGLVGRVMTALATADYVEQLGALSVQFGAAELGCAVDLAIAELHVKASRSDDHLVATMLGRAQAWREANP